MGIGKSDQKVRNTIINCLSNRSAQEFAFRFVHRPVDEFVHEINQYDALLSLRKRKIHSQQSSATSVDQSDDPSSHDALLTDAGRCRNIQCWHCQEWGHHRNVCPDKFIPQEELQRRKQNKVDGNGRGRSYTDNRGRRGSRGGMCNSGYRSCTQRPDDSYVKVTQLDEHAAVALADSDFDKDFQDRALNFDWSSVGPFQDMNSTLSLLPSVEGEHVDSTVKGKALKEEHIVLSAIAATNDFEYYSSQVPFDNDNRKRSLVDYKRPETGFVLSDK